MTEPEKGGMEERFEARFYKRMGDEFWLDNGYYSPPDRQLGEKIKSFIREELAKKDIEREKAAQEQWDMMCRRIGALRMWLNEDRISDTKKFVTNEELEMWLIR